MKNTRLATVIILACISVFVLAGQVLAAPKGSAQVAEIGAYKLNMVGIPNLQRVDMRNPVVQDYLKAREDKFKFKILAIYANPAEWDKFVTALANKKPAKLPRMALIGVTNKMDRKSYDDKGFKKEKKKYGNWYSFAMNTSAVTYTLQKKANKKIQSVTHSEVKVVFDTDRNSIKFDETDHSVSFSTKIAFELFGYKSERLMAVTAIHMGDKIVFIGNIDERGDLNKLEALRAETLKWRDSMSATNKAASFDEV